MDRKRASDDGDGSEAEVKKPRTLEEIKASTLASMQQSMQRAIAAEARIEATLNARFKQDAPAWDSTFEDAAGRIATGGDPAMKHLAWTSRTPWLCGTFPQLRNDSDYDGAPALRVAYGGRTFGSAAAAFGYAKAQYFDERLGKTEDYRNAFADVPEGATPLGDAFAAGITRARPMDKDAIARTIADLGKKFTKAKAGRLHNEIEADWIDDEIEAMTKVLASKFSDANPQFRDLLLATGDKPLYLLRSDTKRDDKYWELGAREADVTTSGLGLYGDLLMARRTELRGAAAS